MIPHKRNPELDIYYLPLLGPLMSQQFDCFLLDGDLGLGDRGDLEEARDMALVGEDVVILFVRVPQFGHQYCNKLTEIYKDLY